MVKPHPSHQDENNFENHTRSPGGIKASDPVPTQPLTQKHEDAVHHQLAQAYAYRAALLMLGAALASGPFYIYLAAQMHAWQFTALIWTGIFIGICAVLSALAARRGQVTLSISILIGSICLLVPLISTLITGLGLVLCIGNMLSTLVIAGQTLRGRAAIRASIAGVLSGLAALLIDLFWTSSRLVIPEFQYFVPVLALITVSVLAFTIVRQFSSYPLRVKLAVMLVGVAIVSIGAVAITMNRVVRRELTQEVGSNLAALARGKALEIGATLNRDTNTLESLALNEALQKEVRESNSVHSGDPAELARLDQAWQAARADADPLLTQILDNEVSAELREYQGRFPEYAEIFLTDRYGANLAATNRTSDYWQADEAWWQSTWNHGEGSIVISQPIFDESTGVYAVNLSIPVYGDGNSEVIGILRATVNVTALKDTLGTGEFSQRGSVDLVFPDYQFLHSDLTGAPTGLDSDSVDSLAALNESYGQFSYEGSPSLVSKSLVSVTNANDRDQIESLGWYVVAHEDQSQALQSIASTTRTGVVIALIVLVLTGLLAVFIGRALARPLDELTAVAARVSEGDLTAQVRIRSQDEIGTLASTFNNMTRQLRSLIGSMEQRVSERTRDLELASEVGRTVSEKVADLQSLLSESVELIRERFNLYYTQIYLVETDGNTLKLYAGTGSAGKTLLQRGHHLVIGSSSLNGRAAANKRAVIVADTTLDANFLPNPLLPRTRSELAVPLIVGGHVVGVLDMQSESPNALTAGDLSAFEALAGQLAVAIQNAKLFAEAQQSKMELEAQARRLTKTGWQEFLDAVERSEHLGYAFDRNTVMPLDLAPSVPVEQVLTVPILIAGEEVGTFQMAHESGQAWSREEAEIARSTASLLATQIENLRLFAQAERYRMEAEQVARRLTREGWEDYLKTRPPLSDGYRYDTNHVQALSADAYADYNPAFSQPVVIRDEVIGELAIDHANGAGQDAAEIVAAVAEELSEHIENLRLLEEAEQRRIEVQQGEARLAEALRIARLGNWEYDVAADQFTFNDQFYLIFHTSVNEVGSYRMSSSEYASRFVHPEDVPLVGVEIGKALASTDRLYKVKLEHRVLYAEGGTGYISVDVNVERDEHGTILRFYGANQDITERKSAELALRESEQRYQQILDAITDMVLVKGEKSRIVWANKSFRDYYGMSNERLRDMIDAPIVNPDLTLQYVKDDAYVFETGDVLSIAEEPCTRYDGMVFPFETVKAPVRDINGNIVMTVGVSRDITERKKAEEVIRMAHQRAQIILESVTIPMVITRLSDNHLTFVNSPAIEVTQFRYEEVINKPAPDFYYNPQDRGEFIRELRSEGLVSNMVVQLRRRSGEPFWALLSARLFEYQGETSILTTFMDISDRIRAQEAVAKRAAELQTVAEVSTTTATTLEPDRLLQAVVDLTKEQFGLYHAHIYLADQSWSTLLLAAGAGEVGRQLVAQEHAIPMDREQSLVARAARERSSIIVNDVRSEPGFLPNPLLPETRAEMAVPMIVGDTLLGVFDVQSTGSQGFSSEDASIYTTLASQVAVALQNARLYVEQSATLAQLRELDRLKSSFLANMSHELRTPLNSILGFADVMLEELDGPLTVNMDNDLRLIQKNGQHLLHLINDVLDMAKIEAGRMNLTPETFKLYEVLDEVTSITSTLASEKNLSLFIDGESDDEVEIYADRTRLRQVMINLVNNSIKFTETGRISIKAVPTEEAKVLITVKDTGIGIPPEKLEAIFQEFTQVDTSSTRKVGGTGLGLPISRRLVEMHGGRLWAESEGVPGEGSVFYVELPVEARITEVIEKQAK